jgi:hypothetical protein
MTTFKLYPRRALLDLASVISLRNPLRMTRAFFRTLGNQLRALELRHAHA